MLFLCSLGRAGCAHLYVLTCHLFVGDSTMQLLPTLYLLNTTKSILLLRIRTYKSICKFPNQLFIC